MYVSVFFIGKLIKKDLVNLEISCWAVFIILSLLEIIFWTTGFLSTYGEKNLGGFKSNWSVNRNEPTWYHTWTESTDVHLEHPEFSHLKKTNSLGIIGEEFPEKKDTAEFRIFVLGDSFTEGEGAAMNKSYPRKMDSLLNQRKSIKYTVLNAGVSGSDIFYNYVLLRDKLMAYQPDLILYTLNSTDLTSDIPIRGGMERFQANNTVVFKSPPWFECIQATSRLSRLFVYSIGYDENLLPRVKDTKVGSLMKSSVEDIAELEKEYDDLIRGYNVSLVIIKHPLLNEFKIESRKKEKEVIQLLESKIHPRTKIVDLLEIFLENNMMDETNAHQYYWPIDQHHNPVGYHKMAEAVIIALEEKGLLPD